MSCVVQVMALGKVSNEQIKWMAECQADRLDPMVHNWPSESEQAKVFEEAYQARRRELKAVAA